MENKKINQNLVIVIKSLALTIIALLVLFLLLSLLRNLGLDILNDSLIGNVLLETTILIVQCLFITKYSKTNILSSIGFNKKRNCLKDIFVGLLIGLISCALIYTIVLSMKISFYKGLGFKFYKSNIVFSYIISVFIRALFAGTCEEIFFRGVLLNYLAKYKGNIFALITSSILFMIFHTSRYQTLNELFYVLTGGLTLGYSYIITESLYLPIGLHFATDFFLSLPNTGNEAGLIILNVNINYDLEQTLFILCTIIYSIIFILLIINNPRKIYSSKKNISNIIER